MVILFYIYSLLGDRILHYYEYKNLSKNLSRLAGLVSLIASKLSIFDLQLQILLLPEQTLLKSRTN